MKNVAVIASESKVVVVEAVVVAVVAVSNKFVLIYLDR